MLCPKYLKLCCDDLCRAGLRCMVTDDPMVVKCPGCGCFVAADGSDYDGCECEPEMDEDGE